jgi:hypothetical protein
MSSIPTGLELLEGPALEVMGAAATPLGGVTSTVGGGRGALGLATKGG